MRFRPLLILCVALLVAACNPLAKNSSESSSDFHPGVATPTFSLTGLAMAQDAVCAIVNGGVQCWGINRFGQLGTGKALDEIKPAKLAALSSGVTSLSNGNGTQHFCAVKNSGVYCWGRNLYGELGNGVANKRYFDPQLVPGITANAGSVLSGNYFSGYLEGGVLKTWGGNSARQLGDTTTTDRATQVAVTATASAITSASLGGLFSCVIVDGSAKCWGQNNHRQTGDGVDTSTFRLAATQVVGLTSGVTLLGLGRYHGCAVMNDQLHCWGENSDGQLGDGTTTDRSTPVTVPGMTTGITAIAARENNTCVIANGVLKCWGNNSDGAVGDGTTTDRSTPTDVVGMSSGVRFVAVMDTFACAIKDDDLWCWGDFPIKWAYGTGNNPIKISEWQP